MKTAKTIVKFLFVSSLIIGFTIVFNSGLFQSAKAIGELSCVSFYLTDVVWNADGIHYDATTNWQGQVINEGAMDNITIFNSPTGGLPSPYTGSAIENGALNGTDYYGSHRFFNLTYANGGYGATVTAHQVFTGENFSADCNLTLEPSPPPTADIKANSSDGPITISYNTSATLSWTSTNTTSCSVNPGELSGTSNGGTSTGNLTTNTTYTLSCTGSGGNASDTVTINVGPALLPRLDLTKIQSTFSYPTNSDTFGVRNVQSQGTTSMNWSGSKNVAWIDTLTSNAAGGTGLANGGTANASFTVNPAQALIGVNNGTITENCLSSSLDSNGVASGCEPGYQTRNLGVQYTVPGPSVTLSANPPGPVTAGTQVTLTWTGSNCNATNPVSSSNFGASNQCSGSTIVTPVVPSSTYTITIKGLSDVDGSGNNFTTASVIVNVNAQTLSVDLQGALDSAAWQQSLSGPAPLSGVDLRASVAGTATGTMNYTFYCNRQDTGTNITTPYDAKFDNVSDNPKITSDLCNYATAGTYYAKVIVERGTAPAAQDQVVITVTVPPNQAPTASNVTFSNNYCVTSPNTTIISWTYSDPNSHPQSAYQVQIDAQGSSFNPPAYDSGKITGSGTSHTANGLPLNQTLRARVKVWDSLDLTSAWSATSNTWKSPNNAYPYVDFCWPENCNAPTAGPRPKPNVPVQFTDRTIFYDGGGNREWSWTFGDGGTSTQQNPSHTYPNATSYTVTLTAEDKYNQSCSVSKQVNIQRVIPIWREISPGQ